MLIKNYLLIRGVLTVALGIFFKLTSSNRAACAIKDFNYSKNLFDKKKPFFWSSLEFEGENLLNEKCN